MENKINCENIKKQIEIIIKKDIKYVLFEDYEQLQNKLLELQSNDSSHKQITQYKNDEFVEINSALQKVENERNYYKNKLEEISKSLQKQNLNVIQLQENCNEINKLYLTCVEEKQKIQNNIQKVIEQRDYAESELINKALQFSKHQDDLNQRMEEFQQQKLKFDKQKTQFEKERMDFLHEGFKNSHMKRKNTFDIQTKKDEFLDVKMVLKKQNSQMLHPDDNKNQKHYYNVMSCAMDSSQKYIATTGMDKRILITDITKNLQPLCEFQTKYIQNVVCFDDKRGTLITGGQNNEISFYSIKNQKKIATFKNHQDQINALKITENNSLISASQDRTIKTWDMKKMRFSGSKMHPSVTLCLDVNSNMVFSGHQDGSLKVCSQNTNKIIHHENLFENGYLNFCQYYSSQNQLFLSSRNRYVKIFDLRMMQTFKEFCLQEFDVFDGIKKSFAADSGLQTLYCGSTSGELKEFDISKNTISQKNSVKITEDPLNIPYVIKASLHDSIFCFDFSGKVTNIKIMSVFG